jgi:hypothetical protein
MLHLARDTPRTLRWQSKLHVHPASQILVELLLKSTATTQHRFE